MSGVLLVCAGALVVGAVFVDAFATTLTVSSGAGPLTSRVLGWLWRAMLHLHRQDTKSSPMTAAGVVLLILTVFTWVVLLWAGCAMVFAGSGAIVDATTKLPAGTLDVIYYSGFTVFTLGTGDFVAATPTWRVVTAAASFSGLFLITLSITYLISVVSAVVQRRSLATQIHGLGRSSAEIVRRGWNGDGFSEMFQQQLISLLPLVVLSAEQHLAYPVLHYFHSREPDLAAPRAIAHLDEALTLLTKGVSEECRPDPSVLEPLQYGIDRYLSTATHTSWSPDVGAPPAPRLAVLAEAGIPHRPAAAYAQALEAERDRRAALHQLVGSDGWSWGGP